MTGNIALFNHTLKKEEEKKPKPKNNQKGKCWEVFIFFLPSTKYDRDSFLDKPSAFESWEHMHILTRKLLHSQITHSTPIEHYIHFKFSSQS